jgi:hypothetical protein
VCKSQLRFREITVDDNVIVEQPTRRIQSDLDINTLETFAVFANTLADAARKENHSGEKDDKSSNRRLNQKKDGRYFNRHHHAPWQIEQPSV